MADNEKEWADMTSSSMKKWWIISAVSVGIIILGAIVAIFFMSWVTLILHSEIVLRPSSHTFDLWRKPPIHPVYKVYIFNVTNAKEFLSNGSKPIVQEVGPYVYTETWEKKNLEFHDNGTVTFNQEKLYIFNRSLSVGKEDDVVIVPNIPMLSATSRATGLVKITIASIIATLNVTPFVEVSVGQLLWGYQDALLKLAKANADQPDLVSDEFGLLYQKNGTSKDNVTLYTGALDIENYGLIDNVNGMSHLPYYTADRCNSLMGSDGSIFPPHVTPETILNVYHKDLCRLLPLSFDKEVVGPNDVQAYRFKPMPDVFGTPFEDPDNTCFYPSGPPYTPTGFFNVSFCALDAPIYLSFPHFYKANDSFRLEFDGITPADPELHDFYIDIHPLMGVAVSARARFQINLAISKVEGIKGLENVPSIVFPIMWFEEGFDGLPNHVTKLMKIASTGPAIARFALTASLLIAGGVLLIISIWRVVNANNLRNTLQLTRHRHSTQKKSEVAMNNVQSNE